MLELCFDMSTRGALRVAQRCGRSGRKGLGFVLSRTEDGGNVTSTTVIGFDDGKAPAGEEIHQIQRAQRRQAALEREAIPWAAVRVMYWSCPWDWIWGISENRWVRTGGTCCAGGVMVMMRPRTGTGSGIWRQRSD